MAGAQAEGAVAGSSCEVPAQGPSQPQTVVPVEPADAAAQDNADAGQVTAQAVSAAMPPPGPAAQNRDVTIKDWEWLAMLLSSLPAAMSWPSSSCVYLYLFLVNLVVMGSYLNP